MKTILTASVLHLTIYLFMATALLAGIPMLLIGLPLTILIHPVFLVTLITASLMIHYKIMKGIL